MEQKINLKKLEKKTAAQIFQTGIVEIGIGLVFIVSSLAMIFDEFRYYIYALYILPVVFIFLGVKYIVNPRLGVAILARRRVRNNKLLMFSVTTFLLFMITLTIFGSINKIGDFINPSWIICGIIFFICIIVAYFMDFHRMYIYAFLLTGSFYLSEVMRENSWYISEGGYAYLLASIILICTGCV